MLDVPVPLLKGQSVSVHAHVAREAGHVSALLSSLNPKTGEVAKAKPRWVGRWEAPLHPSSASPCTAAGPVHHSQLLLLPKLLLRIASQATPLFL